MNPLDLAVVSMYSTSGSRMCAIVCANVKNAIDEVLTRDVTALYLAELQPEDLHQSGRWESNPRPPGYEPCTPNRQSIVCFKKLNEVFAETFVRFTHFRE